MENEKNQNKAWRITSIVLNVVFYTLIAILLLFSIANLTVKNEDVRFRIPSLFGVGLMQVESPSMTGSNRDSFTENDAIVVKKVTVIDYEASEKKIERQFNKLLRQTRKLEVGDIITFVAQDQYDVDGDNDRTEEILITHRIIEVHTDESSGNTYYITQGDKAKEAGRTDDTEIVNVTDIRAIYRFKLSGFGSVLKFVKSSTGFMVCIVVPTAIFFVVQLIFLILNIQKQRQSKTTNGIDVDLEKLKEEMLAQERERIRAEILAETAKTTSEENPEENKKE